MKCDPTGTVRKDTEHLSTDMVERFSLRFSLTVRHVALHIRPWCGSAVMFHFHLGTMSSPIARFPSFGRFPRSIVLSTKPLQWASAFPMKFHFRKTETSMDVLLAQSKLIYALYKVPGFPIFELISHTVPGDFTLSITLKSVWFRMMLASNRESQDSTNIPIFMSQWVYYWDGRQKCGWRIRIGAHTIQRRNISSTEHLSGLWVRTRESWMPSVQCMASREPLWWGSLVLSCLLYILNSGYLAHTQTLPWLWSVWLFQAWKKKKLWFLMCL